MLATIAAHLLLSPDADKGYIMRLKLHEGEVIKYDLLIERDKPKQSGVFSSSYTIAKIHAGTIDMDCRAIGLKIDGKNRTSDLNKAWGGQVAKLPWTELSHRTGMAIGYNASKANGDIIPYLYEAGIYFPYFKRDAVKPGDTWVGSTTATGGCTDGTFTLKQVKTEHGKQLAYFDVTDIKFLDRSNAQLGPMRMVVDLSNGLPTVVDYKVKNSSTGRTSHFRQTLVKY